MNSKVLNNTAGFPVRSNGISGFNGLINDIFNHTLSPSIHEHMDTKLPKVNIKETDAAYEVELMASGYAKEDFDIDVLRNRLKIKATAKTESEDDEKYLVREFEYHSFERSFRLPKNVNKDSISAKYDNGVLFISIPKETPKEAEVKKIAIQ